jgi:hypothetical protein
MRNNLRLRGYDCIIMLIAFLFTVTFGTLEAKVINPDGGFEAAAVTVGDDTSGVEGWSFQQASAGLANFVIVDDTVYEGNLALKITINSLGSNAWDIQAVNEPFPVVPGVTYHLSVWARTETGTASANFTAGAPDYSEYGRLEVTDLSPTWHEYTFNFSAPTGQSQGRIPIHFSLSGNEGKVIYLDALTITGPNFVDMWGKTNRGKLWPIMNTATTLVGEATIGDSARPTGWSTIRGGFNTLEATTDQAFVISGQMELVGGGGEDAYTWLRYALTYQDSMALDYQYTDSATWNTTGKTEYGHYGYEFTPRSGTGTIANGTNGVGTIWTVPGGTGWNSTYSGQVPLKVVRQAPRNAKANAGIYNWAMSVQPLGDGSNEIRWKMIKDDNKYYYAGSVIDTAEISTKFNGVCFGFNSDIEAILVNFKSVQVKLGAPIDIPEAPFEAFYVDEWGATNRGTLWPIMNDSATVASEATIGDSARPTGWSTIRGGFGEPVEATTSKAIIVRGMMELVGGGGASAYTWLRYALTYQDSIALNYQYTDSARWITTGTTEHGHYGYEFTPRSGTGTVANGTNGVGTVWTVPGVTGWNSTYSGQVPLTLVRQAPRNAEATAGLYNWAISVQPLGDGSTEVRWYLIKQDNKYWYGGITRDPAGTSSKFNGICFGFNSDIEAILVNFYEVQVDKGDPITIPEAPFEPFYVGDWGFSGGNLGGWDLTRGDVVGTVTIGGTAAPTGLAAISGGFGEPFVLTPATDRALKVTGILELVGGGFEDLASLRYGLFYSDSAGTTTQDSTLDSNWVWTGTDRAHSGYLFVPPSGTNIASWSGESGTWGAIVNDTWWDIDGSNNFPLGVPVQMPADAVAGPGTYTFAISILPQSIGNLVRTTLEKSDGTYYYQSYTAFPGVGTTNKINYVAFAIDNSTTTELRLMEVKVDRGAQITDIDGGVTQQIPTVYSLSQNYPNPFNPTTTIEFNLPQAGDVNLVVYDVTGRTVAELASGHYNAGSYKINFNAANLASGIYFYRLKAKDFVSVKKLILLK